MVTGRGYGYRPGPEITRGYISIISGAARHDFLYQFFALIPIFYPEVRICRETIVL